jgi:hypothetical protein
VTLRLSRDLVWVQVVTRCVLFKILAKSNDMFVTVRIDAYKIQITAEPQANQSRNSDPVHKETSYITNTIITAYKRMTSLIK